jgi:hypothetical protein
MVRRELQAIAYGIVAFIGIHMLNGGWPLDLSGGGGGLPGPGGTNPPNQFGTIGMEARYQGATLVGASLFIDGVKVGVGKGAYFVLAGVDHVCSVGPVTGFITPGSQTANVGVAESVTLYFDYLLSTGTTNPGCGHTHTELYQLWLEYYDVYSARNPTGTPYSYEEWVVLNYPACIGV